MRFSARVLIIALVFSFFSLFSTSAFAQSNYLTPNTNEDVPKNLHSWTQNVTIEVMSAMICQLIGRDPINPDQRCLGIDRQTGKVGFVDNGGGAIGVLTGMISYLYTPPIHFHEYTQYLAGNFGIAKKTYAQGVGYEGIRPLTRAWSMIRNIAYVFFVVIFVLVGVAVMLRVRIDPRTVMTVQNQIPKIIIALILVTFSFAIAGLLIDIMWITTYMIISLFTLGTPTQPALINAPNVANNINVTPLSFLNYLFFGGIGGVASGASESISTVIVNSFSIPNTSCTGFDILCWFSSSVQNVLISFISGVIGIAAFLIVIVAILWALFKLWFALLKSYIYVLIDIIFAPIWIMSGLIPGSSSGFTSWLRSILSNLMVFPITLGMFLLGRFFMEAFTTSTNPNSFLPPLLSNPGNIGIFGPLIGVGIILILPNVVEISKGIFKPQSLPTGDPLKALGAGQAVVGASAGFAWRRAMRPAEQYRDAGALRQGVRRVFAGPVPERTEVDGDPVRIYSSKFHKMRYDFFTGIFGQPKKLIDQRAGEKPLIK